jgi:hypothetical protein
MADDDFPLVCRTPPVSVPHGLAALIKTYGNPFQCVDDKATWEGDRLTTLPLGVHLPYAYVKGVTVTRIRAHKQIAAELAWLLERAASIVTDLSRIAYGGCYSWRPMRGSTRLSTHTWGIAVDLDPARNPLGKAYRPETGIPETVVQLFEDAGWTWGGRWARPDCQHFQRVGGY